MKRFKFLPLILWLLFLSPILPGCGGGGTLRDDPSAAGSPSPSPEEQPDTKPISIKPAYVFESLSPLDKSDQLKIIRNIWISDLDGKNQIPFTELTNSIVRSSHPRFSPDHTQIVFDSMRAFNLSNSSEKSNNIWISDVERKKIEPLTHFTKEFLGASEPFFSPDGKKIVFTTNASLDGKGDLNINNVSNIAMMDLDGKNVVFLTQLTAEFIINFSPKFSPDGSKIAFLSNRSLDGKDVKNSVGNNVWIMDVDGKNPKPLTKSQTQNTANFNFHFSPDSKSIVFYSIKNLNGSDTVSPNRVNNIWNVDIATAVESPVTKLLNAGSKEGVFLDNETIVFSSNRDLNGNDAVAAPAVTNLWSMKINGNELKAVTKSTAERVVNDLPQFSTTLNKIVFESNGNLDEKIDGLNLDKNMSAVPNIWEVNLDGTNKKAVTTFKFEGVQNFSF